MNPTPFYLKIESVILWLSLPVVAVQYVKEVKAKYK